MIISFTLPAPPSANRIWRVGGGKVHKSREYRQWIVDNSWQVLSKIQAQGQYGALSGPISVTIVVRPRDKRLRDIDNYAKPVLDFCELIDLIENDRQVERLLIFRGEPADTHFVEVGVGEL